MNDDVTNDARTIWDHMTLHQEVGNDTCMVVLGSRDERVAHYVAKLAAIHNYERIIVTGGSAHHNDLPQTAWPSRVKLSILKS